MILAHCDRGRLDPNWVVFGTAHAIIEVIETVESGKAKVSFTASRDFLHLKHVDNKPPLKWMRNRQCADAGIVLDYGESLHLHVVELKSTLRSKDWDGVRSQFSGMIANVIALLAAIGAPKPSGVTCHVSYTRNQIRPPVDSDPADTADTIALKMQVGSKEPLIDLSDWHLCRLDVFGYTNVELRKIPRDIDTGEGKGSLDLAAA